LMIGRGGPAAPPAMLCGSADAGDALGGPDHYSYLTAAIKA